MAGVATERATASCGQATGRDVPLLVKTYLAYAGGDPYRALADAIADALLELDASATALRDRDRLVSAGYVRAGRPAPDRP